MSLACATGCTSDGRHLTDCPCTDPNHAHDADTCPQCGGCQPRPALGGMQVCNGCVNGTQRRLGELPDLWVDLAERPRLAGVSTAPETTDAPPEPIGSDRRAERSAIKAMLVNWCLTLADDFAITVPDEREITATTRRIAAHYSDQAAQAQNAVRLLEMPTDGPLVRNPDGASTLRRETARLTRLSAEARADRETDRDIIRALAEHIRRHADTLLADPNHADQLVTDIRTAHAAAKRKAYPIAPAGVTVVCPSCSNRTQAKPDAAGDITCPSCGDKGDAAWWGGSTQREPMAFDDLRKFLALNGLHVTVRQIRGWADRGYLESTRPTRGDDGRMQDRLFDPIEASHVVAKLLAQKRHERSVA